MEFAAVITAGGRVDGEFARVIGTDVKALAPFRESTLLQRTITAVRDAGIRRIAVVGGTQVRAACGGMVESILDEGADGSQNILLALRAWNDRYPLLYLTSDMPYVADGPLRAFVDAVPEDTLALPLSEWNDFTQRFPDAPPYGVTLAGERVVNGGVFAVPAGAAAHVERFATEFFEARKNVWRMARLTGPMLLVQFALHRLGIAQLEVHAHRLLGIPAKAIRNAPPELAYDVDELEEYRYAAHHA